MLQHPSPEAFFENLSVGELKEIQKGIQHLSAWFNSFSSKFLAMQQLYVWIEKKQEQWPKEVGIKCKGTGCSGCCSIKVVCTELEAKAIVAYAGQHRIFIDKDKLKHQSKLGVDEYVLSPHKRCVFLGYQDRCNIYDVRPIACRLHNSVIDPKFCDTDKYPKYEVVTYFNMGTSIASVALSEVSPLKPLSVHLLKLLSK